MGGVRPAGSNPLELGFWVDGKTGTREAEGPRKTESNDVAAEVNGLRVDFRRGSRR